MIAAAYLRASAAAGHFVRLGVVLAGLLAGAAPAAASPAPMLPDSGTIAAPAPGGTPRSDWQRRLTGIVISGNRRAAIFARPGETRSVREGQQIDGWTLIAIRPDSITLEAEGETMTLAPTRLAQGETPTWQGGPPPNPQAQQARAVADSLARQRADQAAAEAALAAATAKMKRR